MFGLSWVEIIIILGVGVFVLGPERIPVAVRWVTTTMTKVRGMAATAQSDLAREIGPELDELRRQVSDLQSMKEFQDLKSLRDINPKRYLQKNILGDQFSGGVTGFLGLNGEGTPAEQANAAAAADAASVDTGTPAVPVPAAAMAPAMDLAYPTRRVTHSLAPGELAPFDSDGT